MMQKFAFLLSFAVLGVAPLSGFDATEVGSGQLLLSTGKVENCDRIKIAEVAMGQGYVYVAYCYQGSKPNEMLLGSRYLEPNQFVSLLSQARPPSLTSSSQSCAPLVPTPPPSPQPTFTAQRAISTATA